MRLISEGSAAVPTVINSFVFLKTYEFHYNVYCNIPTYIVILLFYAKTLVFRGDVNDDDDDYSLLIILAFGPIDSARNDNLSCERNTIL